MARIIICDYLKQPLKKDDPTFVVVVDGNEFEVGEEGKGLLLKQLEGETAPLDNKKVDPIVVVRDPVPPGLTPAVPGIDIEVPGDPFDTGPGSMPQPVMGAMPGDDVPPLEFPDNPTKKLKMPTPVQADKVVLESTKFEEGSLPALTMGARAQKEAMRKLRALESTQEDKLKRKAPPGVNVNAELGDRPGYYD